jgi:hypothetical protein
MKTHEELIAKMLEDPAMRAELERLESSMTTGKHSPTLATLRKYVEACGKRLVVSVV